MGVSMIFRSCGRQCLRKLPQAPITVTERRMTVETASLTSRRTRGCAKYAIPIMSITPLTQSGRVCHGGLCA
jgi:hypothetical protein